MTSTVAIADYGMGNLDSVARAVYECGGHPAVTHDAVEVSRAAAVILPGVGAFAKGMENIGARGFDRVLAENVIAEGIPLLGLCLGMQLLATRGEEGAGAEGLGVIPGVVRRLEPPDSLRVPHVGWNEVRSRRPSRLFEGIADGRDFYFVHSFHLIPDDEADIVATTSHGSPLVAAVERGNVFGVQFHPEKSQRAGFALLRNFLSLAGCIAPRDAAPIGFSAPRR